MDRYLNETHAHAHIDTHTHTYNTHIHTHTHIHLPGFIVTGHVVIDINSIITHHYHEKTNRIESVIDTQQKNTSLSHTHTYL